MSPSSSLTFNLCSPHPTVATTLWLLRPFPLKHLSLSLSSWHQCQNPHCCPVTCHTDSIKSSYKCLCKAVLCLTRYSFDCIPVRQSSWVLHQARNIFHNRQSEYIGILIVNAEGWFKCGGCLPASGHKLVCIAMCYYCVLVTWLRLPLLDILLQLSAQVAVTPNDVDITSSSKKLTVF
jgi:hypothetical protein